MFSQRLITRKVADLWRARQDSRLQTAECCGIIGYIGNREAVPILINGVNLMQNRGYDSCGITTVRGKALVTTKMASKGTTSDCIDQLNRVAPKNHKGDQVGIAHTRWATHGDKTDENAHPHHDYKNRIALVHNGTIDNFEDLKRELSRKGIKSKTQTDSEVIANLIGSYLDQGQDFQRAVTSAVRRLRGTWGLLVMHKDHPNGFMIARNGSPICIGSRAGQVFVASEPLALASHTNEYLALHDGDICYVSTSEGIKELRDKGRQTHEVPDVEIEHEPTPFKHWTIKEIYEQPQSISRALNFGARLGGNTRKVKLGGLDENKEDMSKITNLVVTGCGTSLHAGLFGSHIFQDLKVFDSVTAIDSSELNQVSLPHPHHSCGLLALTQSGETRDVVQAIEEAKKSNVRCLSVVNVVGSLVARLTGCGVYLNAGREVAVASTKAFTSQVVILTLMACWFSQLKGDKLERRRLEYIESLQRLPHQASEMLRLDGQCKKIAKRLADSKSMFILGKGLAHSVALEAALKIKEIAYCHAEGFGGGQLKHGPFAMIDESVKTPCILIAMRDEHSAAMLNVAQQVKARGAYVIVITDDPSLVQSVADETITVPENGPLTALNSVIPIQLLAYHMAVVKGINPDKPRGLAKTVTVM